MTTTAQSTSQPARTDAPPRLKYVIITPARNEAAFIELTIQSMIAQTSRPEKWIIVSDGSTDGTDDIVMRHAEKHPWIHLVRTPERRERHFAGKVHAFNAGYETIGELEYDCIGSLDADITFGPDYFPFLLRRLEQNPQLGLVGSPFREGNVSYDYRFASLEHVSGACQLFRRACFEQIGGYRPIKSGGIDLVAVLSARLKGWQTRTFPEQFCEHHRKQGSATKSGLAVILNDGRKDYQLGAHPVWEAIRGIYKMTKPPYVLGGACLLWGYFWPMVRRVEKTAPADVIEFRRKEQSTRLRAIVRRTFLPWTRKATVRP